MLQLFHEGEDDPRSFLPAQTLQFTNPNGVGGQLSFNVADVFGR